MTLHKDVEEVGDGCKICQLTVDVNSPEVWMARWVLCIREAQQVNCDVADNILIVKRTTN